MINLAADTISKKELIKLSSWLKTNPQLTLGKKTLEFEKKWSKWLGRKYSIFVNSGSSTILLTLQTLKEQNLLKNNKIVIPALSWATDFAPVQQLGFKHYLCDCNLKDLSVDLQVLEKIFKKEKPSILLLVSVLGLVPKMSLVKNLCKKYGVLLLEDACESLGSKFKNKKLGTFGFASFFSFYFGHHISTIEGGMISTDNRDFYNVLTAVRSHGWSRNMEKKYQNKLSKKFSTNSFNEKFTFYYSGFNLRPTEIQSFLGLMQLKKINKISKIREKNFKSYLQTIKPTFWKPQIDDGNFVSNMGYPIISKSRDNILKILKKYKIDTRPIICGSISKQPFYYKKFKKKKLINADSVYKYGLYLPNHTKISKKNIKFILSKINIM